MAGSLRRVAGAVALWLVLALLLTGLYELIDGVFLSALPHDAHDDALRLRSLAISLTASVVTAVYVLRRSLHPLNRTLSLPPQDGDADATVDRVALSAWLLGLRWVALVVLAAVVSASTIEHTRVAPGAVFPLWLGLAALFLFNAGLSIAGSSRLARKRSFFLQVMFDVAVLAWMVHHAGGLSNPFGGVFVFPAVIAAITLPESWSKRTIGGVAATTMALALLEASGVLPPSCLRGLGSECRSPDPLLLAAAGMAVSVVTLGCGLFVVALRATLTGERDRLLLARGELLSEQEKLQSIIDCMADVVIFADPAGSVRLRNRAANRLWGQGPPADGDLRVCHSPSTWEKLLAKLAAPRESEQHPVLQVDGKSYEALFARVAGPRNDLSGVVMVARDVTERLATQEWRMREERMSVVGKMSASLAHELNNPLGAISLFTQHALSKVPADQPLAEHLSTVLRNADLCKKIVRDLLTFARQRPPHPAPLDVAALLDHTKLTLTFHAERAGITVRVEHGCDTDDAPLVADADQLTQVLVNLGLNGLEAMERGGTLSLRAMRLASGWLLEVQDTGPGIAQDQRERVFEAFHTTKSDGTGLGLAVARDIVGAHGGTISVDCPVEGGCTFSVLLPDRPSLLEPLDAQPAHLGNEP